MPKKPSYRDKNLPQLVKLCNEHGFEIKDINHDQVRVFGATHIFDIWPARMVYHRIDGEDIKSNEPYNRELSWEFNKDQVSKLLMTGSTK